MEINSVKKTVQFSLTLDLNEAKQLHQMHGEMTAEDVRKFLGAGFTGISDGQLASQKFYELLDKALMTSGEI